MKRIRWLILVIALALFLVGGIALANSGYAILSWKIAGGGGYSQSSDGYGMVGTAGQHDASQPLQGGGFTVVGGFLAPEEVPIPELEVFLPVIIR